MASGTSLTLLERVARQDPEAVQLVLDRFGPLVWTIVRRQAAPDVAEDLVQEIFIEVWQNAGRYDPSRASESTFVTTLARRRLIDSLRKRGRRPPAEELLEEAVAAGDPERADPVEVADEARLAADAVARLKPDQRRVLRMAVVEGLTHTRIAEITRLPLGTVKSHVRRGLERVRAELGARGAPQADGRPG